MPRDTTHATMPQTTSAGREGPPVGSPTAFWAMPERLAAVGIVLLVAFAFIVSIDQWSDRWLHNDVWGYIQRGWTLDGLLTPHAGHPVPLNIGLALALRDLVGFDTAVHYAALRGLAWVAFLASFAWSVASRGGSWFAALLGTGVLALWPLAAWQEGWYVSNPVAYATALALALVIANSESPTLSRLTLVTVAIGFLSISTTSGTILAFALAIAIFISGRWRDWWIASISAPVVYVLWRLVYGLPEGAIDPSQLRTGFSTWYKLIIAGLETTFTADRWLAIGLLVVSVGIVAYSLFRKRPDLTDVTVILATSAFVVSIAVYRISQGLAELLADRYQYAVIIFLLAIVLPRIPPASRISARWASLVTVLAVLALVLPVHLNTTIRSNDFWERRTASERELLAAEYQLLASGEPSLPNAPTGVQPLWTKGFRSLLDAGLAEVLGGPVAARIPEARAWLQLGPRRLGSAADNEECSAQREYTLSEPSDFITVSGAEGTIELLTARGPALMSLPRQGTYVLKPVFDDEAERIRVSDSLCVLDE